MSQHQKYQDILAMLDKEKASLTQSLENYLAYLDGASRNYKYGFTQQLLINAQKPHASAIADYDFWTKRGKRTVKKSAPHQNYKAAIQLPVTDANGNTVLKNFFDVSDTLETDRSLPINPWQLQEAYHQGVQERLAETYGLETPQGNDLALIVHVSVDAQTQRYLNQQLSTTVTETFAQLVSASAKLIAFKRLGLANPNEQANLTTINQHIQSIDTDEHIMSLGNAVSQVSETILRAIETNIKTQARKLSREEPTHDSLHATAHRHNPLLRAQGRANLQPDAPRDATRGHDLQQKPVQSQWGYLADPRPSGRNGQGQPVLVQQSLHELASNHTGQLGQKAAQLPPGTQPHSGQQPRLHGTTPTLQGDRNPSRSHVHPTDGTSQSRQAQPANRAGQSHQPHGMGSPHEQPQAPHPRADLHRPDLQLTLNQKLADNGELFLTPISDEEVDGVILNLGRVTRIREFFEQVHDKKARVQFLKDHYGTGGMSHAYGEGKESISEMHSPAKGLALSKGRWGTETYRTRTIDYGTVAERIDALMVQGRYLSRKERRERQAVQSVTNNLSPTGQEVALSPEEQAQVEANTAEQRAFAQRLADYVANPEENRTQPIYVSKTPNSLLMLGAKQLDMIIRPSEVDKCMATEVTEAIKHPHNLTLEDMQQMPALLANPVMLFEGAHKNSVVALTDIRDKDGDPIIIALQFDSKLRRHIVNRVTSMYGKRNALEVSYNGVRGYIQCNIEEGKLLAYNTKKATDFLQTSGLQLPIVEDQIIGFDNSIPYSLKSIKPLTQESLTQPDPVAHLRVANNRDFIRQFQAEARAFDFRDLTLADEPAEPIEQAPATPPQQQAQLAEQSSELGAFLMQKTAPLFVTSWDADQDLIDLSLFENGDTVAFDAKGVAHSVTHMDTLTFITSTTQLGEYYEVLGSENIPSHIRQLIRAYNEGALAHEEVRASITNTLSPHATPHDIAEHFQPTGQEVTPLEKENLQPQETPPTTQPNFQPAGQEVTPIQSPPIPKPKNHRLDPTTYHSDIASGGPKTKFQRNLAAIKTLKHIERENRTATPAEQAILAKYVGWGGIADAFDARKTDWAKEHQALTELLTPDEYEAARASTLTAYYTDPIIMQAMWEKLGELGQWMPWADNLSEVQILEPAMGVGNFLGAMPAHLSDKAQVHGVELDSLSGRIAKQLYPDAKVQVTGFERTLFADDQFDIAIGNVPFSNDIKPNDYQYDKHGLNLHDYFFVKSLDKVKSGGVVAFITSIGTLDKPGNNVRRMLAEKAELLGAVRLPNTAFKQNAGTAVVSDIIFLQKRDVPLNLDDLPLAEQPRWLNTQAVNYPVAEGQHSSGRIPLYINQYFTENPHMILGEYREVSGSHGRKADLFPLHENLGIFGVELKAAMTSITGQIIPQRQLSEKAPEVEQNSHTLLFNPDERINGFINAAGERVTAVDGYSIPKDNAYTLHDSTLYYRDGNALINQDPTGKLSKTVQRQLGMVTVRDATRALIKAQVDDRPDTEITQLQKALSTVYDDFVATHGLITASENAKAFDNDDSYFLLTALEILDHEGHYQGKSDFFTKRTIKPHIRVTQVNTSAEALAVSLGETGHVSLPLMQDLTDFSREKLLSDLQGQLFLAAVKRTPLHDPNDPREFLRDENGDIQYTEFEDYQPADAFLSGNVKKKLTHLKALAETDPRFATSVTALEAVIPPDIPASDLTVRLGTTWIPEHYVQQFMYELLETPAFAQAAYDPTRPETQWNSHLSDEKDRIVVRYAPIANEWRITNKNSRSKDIKANTTYGTKALNAYHIIEKTLNLKEVVIKGTRTNDDGNEVEYVMEEETTLARQKQADIKAAFVDWLFNDPDRRNELTHLYNERFNHTVPRQFEGSHLTFGGINAEITLDKHQVDAVARVVYGGTTGLFHEVGAGKSYTMAATAMECKRLGLANKSLIAVPKHLTGQMAAEMLRLYPNANILVATDKSFDTKNRKKFCAKIATGNYDAIIMGHTQLEMIPMSVAYQKQFLLAQRETLIKAIEQAGELNRRSFSVKQMEAAKKKIDAKLKAFDKQQNKDQVVTFEELGIDRLFVDEADIFKNLQLFTKMSNVAGISTTSSERSADMFMKTSWINEQTGGKGVILGTGTPISNSMTELYTMQRYLQYDKLVEMGLEHFDQWASVFTEPTSEMELAPDGTGYRLRTRCAKFVNLPELMTMFKEVADIQTAESLNLPRPEAEYITVVAKPTEIQKELVQALGQRAEAVRNGRVRPSEDNMLAITGDGRKTGLDQRVVNPNLPDNPNSKVNLAVSNIYNIWETTQADKLTQVLFCDLSTPSATSKKTKTFNVYDDIKQKLLAKGIPEKEIAFIHDYNTDKQKQKLFAEVRKGNIRVVFGSTEKMGAGTNIQNKMVALHALDCPWRPRDITQREGRIIRRGNENKQVKIFNYVTEGTFDAYLWQTNEKKQSFISQIMTDKSPMRTLDDVDQTVLNFAEVKALCAGDPKIKEKMDLDQDIKRLSLLKTQHNKTLYAMQDAVAKSIPAAIERSEQAVAGHTADLAHVKTHTVESGEGYINPLIVNGNTYTKRNDAGEAVASLLNTVTTSQDSKIIGSYRGFEMHLSFDSWERIHLITLKGEQNYPVRLNDSFSPSGLVTRLDNLLNDLPKYIEQAKQELANNTRQLASAKEAAVKPFAQEEELKTKLARVAELNTQLMLDAQKEAPKPQAAHDPIEVEAQADELTAMKPLVEAKPQAIAPWQTQTLPAPPQQPLPQQPTPQPPTPKQRDRHAL